MSKPGRRQRNALLYDAPLISRPWGKLCLLEALSVAILEKILDVAIMSLGIFWNRTGVFVEHVQTLGVMLFYLSCAVTHK